MRVAAWDVLTRWEVVRLGVGWSQEGLDCDQHKVRARRARRAWIRMAGFAS